MIESVRLSGIERQQLINIKRVTGIENWNVLCRIAFCLSLSDTNDPPPAPDAPRGAVEMTWQTFAGTQPELYRALVEYTLNRSGQTATFSEWFYRHLNHGIKRLAGTISKAREKNKTLEIEDLCAAVGMEYPLMKNYHVGSTSSPDSSSR